MRRVHVSVLAWSLLGSATITHAQPAPAATFAAGFSFMSGDMGHEIKKAMLNPDPPTPALRVGAGPAVHTTSPDSRNVERPPFQWPRMKVSASHWMLGVSMGVRF